MDDLVKAAASRWIQAASKRDEWKSVEVSNSGRPTADMMMILFLFFAVVIWTFLNNWCSTPKLGVGFIERQFFSIYIFDQGVYVCERD